MIPLGCLLPLFLALQFSKAQQYYPSIPEDIYAFPKSRVAFLNGLWLDNDTAQRWLSQGLKGGENEFLGREWTESDEAPIHSRPEIDASEASSTSHPRTNVSLQLMRLGSKTSYLCLIPPPPLTTSFSSNSPNGDEKTLATRSPIQSWELLEPMEQGCLYHAQGWFTYAYCHGKYVKQFREAPHTHPHPAGGRIPEEDPEWESYYLGVSPDQSSLSELISRDEIAAANKLELARGAGHRYLVQRWSDGTLCDKTRRGRQIEVQFHCSMTSPDKIFLIKETSTCQYVLIIHTPRLCGEPGFKSERDTADESVTRCREILSPQDARLHQNRVERTASGSRASEWFGTGTGSKSASGKEEGGKKRTAEYGLGEGAHPQRFPLARSNTPPSPPPAPKKTEKVVKEKEKPASMKKDPKKMIAQTLQALLNRQNKKKKNRPDPDDLDNVVEDQQVGADRDDDDEEDEDEGPKEIVVELPLEEGEEGGEVLVFVDDLDDLDGEVIKVLKERVRKGDADAGMAKRIEAIRQQLLDTLGKTRANSIKGKKGKQEDQEEKAVPAEAGVHDEL